MNHEQHTAENYRTSDGDASLYSAGYAVFLKRTNFRDQIESAVRKFLPRNPHSFSKDKIRVLDIGCGTGEMTCRYLNSLTEAFPRTLLQLDLVEPASLAISAAAASIHASFPKAEVQVHPSKVEEFLRATTEHKTTFDWIIASHVFYHIDPNLIASVAGRLSETGTLMITMGAPDHPLKRQEALRDLARHGDSALVSAVLEEPAFQTSFQYEMQTVSTDLDLNGLWTRGAGLTEEGKAYFSFAYNRNLDTFPENAQTAFRALLEQVFERGDGFVHPKHRIFWVRRKPKGTILTS